MVSVSVRVNEIVVVFIVWVLRRLMGVCMVVIGYGCVWCRV